MEGVAPISIDWEKNTHHSSIAAKNAPTPHKENRTGAYPEIAAPRQRSRSIELRRINCSYQTRYNHVLMQRGRTESHHENAKNYQPANYTKVTYDRSANLARHISSGGEITKSIFAFCFIRTFFAFLIFLEIHNPLLRIFLGV